jgi:hypothetical protein
MMDLLPTDCEHVPMPVEPYGLLKSGVMDLQMKDDLSEPA